MPTSDPFPKEWPEWLLEIAVRVDELISEPKVLARFQAMLKAWAEQHAKDPKSILRARRAISLPQGYALVSAIHDVVCSDTVRIDLWGIHDEPDEDDYPPPLPHAAYYAALCSNFDNDDDLQDVRRSLVERSLKCIEDDLVCAQAVAPIEPLGPKHTASSDKGKSQCEITPVLHAVAILFVEPGISVNDLAKRVGVNKGTIYRSPGWSQVRQSLTAAGAYVPKGSKPKDGPIEAEGEFREFHPTDK